ncbi:hypothetical protein [Paenibacillus aestuarii]|uniref:Integral membrane protein n=1 Tax=Paenibacillus aestuarii TaxID=516965 RepID=A0ABW0K9E5_9BACL|nr:hypothetical protein [Paenibacillus aestuarii]
MADWMQVPAILISIILGAIAIFQLLLFLGFPLGEYGWGGKHAGVLPPRLRMMSLPSAVLLVFMSLIFLIHTHVVSSDLLVMPTQILVWIITIFLAVNTLGNLASKSKKERLVMTPLSGLACLLSLTVAIFTGIG